MSAYAISAHAEVDDLSLRYINESNDRFEHTRKVYSDGDHIHCFYVTPASVGARCSSVVRAFAHGAMGRRIDPSWGGPIELFLVPASAPRQRPWYVLSCLWDDAYKRTLAGNRKE